MAPPGSPQNRHKRAKFVFFLVRSILHPTNRSLQCPLSTGTARLCGFCRKFKRVLNPKFSNFFRCTAAQNFQPKIVLVGCRIGRSGAKCEILIHLTDLWRSRRSHGAKISERIQKFIFLVFQRYGNAPFCAERPDQLKFLRFEGGDDPNRPSRFEWTAKIRKPFVLSGPSPQKSGLVEV